VRERGRLHAVATVRWDKEIAEAYDATSAAMFDPAVLDPVVDRLAELAGAGPALELAIGTGRVALPLRGRGVEVHGIELSAPMVDQLRAKPGGADIPVTIGDMCSTRVPGTFTLVYLVWNALMNVTTQDEQVAVFENAAAHLAPGGRFVIEVGVPELRRVPPGEVGQVFALDADHVGIDTLDDLVGQISSSHHWWTLDGRLLRHSAPYRYVWPSEVDLMARVAGLRLQDRWSNWTGTPFTSNSEQQVAVFEKPA
jgi:SAM-dependent methyltransferase